MGGIITGMSAVVTIFRSRLSDRDRSTYDDMASRMYGLAAGMPGYIEAKVFTADDGERVTIVTFDSWEHHDAWKHHVEHVEAQRRGRETFYDEYLLQVCELVRERRFVRGSSGDG